MGPMLFYFSLLQEDSKQIASEEHRKREELNKKFQNTMREITSKMEEQGNERLKQLKENDM
jgi:hypothetical protein